jgi:hypothetical protein
VALVLLFVVAHADWVILVFPAWVLMVSVYILITHLAGRAPGPVTTQTGATTPLEGP